MSTEPGREGAPVREDEGAPAREAGVPVDTAPAAVRRPGRAAGRRPARGHVRRRRVRCWDERQRRLAAVAELLDYVGQLVVVALARDCLDVVSPVWSRPAAAAPAPARGSRPPPAAASPPAAHDGERGQCSAAGRPAVVVFAVYVCDFVRVLVEGFVVESVVGRFEARDAIDCHFHHYLCPVQYVRASFLII